MASATPPFDKQKHLKYWQRCLRTLLPYQYTSHDSTRMALGFFIVSAFDVLSDPSADPSTSPLTDADRRSIRDWVLSLQHPDGGFYGSPNHVLPLHPGYSATGIAPDEREPTPHVASAPNPGRAAQANIAATCFALLTLALVARDEEAAGGAYLSVNRKATLKWLRKLQREDGSFGEMVSEDGQVLGGRDTRYLHLAASIRWCLRGDARKGDDGWVEDIDVEALVRYIRRSQTYDGGIAESSRTEPHAGYAYCAVSALYLLDRPLSSSGDGIPPPGPTLRDTISDLQGLLKFLASRQFKYIEPREDTDEDDPNFVLPLDFADLSLDDSTLVGFNGRWNKLADTCYTWWVGGTLAMLDHSSLIDSPPARRFLLTQTQHIIGGFSKAPGGPPDIYHAYLGLAALVVLGEPSLKPFDPSLGVSAETARKIEKARAELIDASGKTEAKKEEQDVFWADKKPHWPKETLDEKTAAAVRLALGIGA